MDTEESSTRIGCQMFKLWRKCNRTRDGVQIQGMEQKKEKVTRQEHKIQSIRDCDQMLKVKEERNDETR